MKHASYAYGKNHWLCDPDLEPILRGYWRDLDAHKPELEAFGELAGGRAYEVADFVFRQGHPVLQSHDTDGNRVDRARLSPAHADLLKQMAHINRPPFEGGSWHHHFALGYLLADPGLYCSLIVTNQTVHAIYKYAPELAQWIEPLLSGEAWGATWMTEIQGGSDLGANRVRAVRDGAYWRIFGDEKYFTSNAGLADLALITARPEGAPQGPKGLGLFLVPRLDPEGGLNFRVRRLKEKSATRAVPTGEVDFAGSLGYLVGQADLGIYYTLENLTVSRLANAAGAMGLARKAHLEALYRTAERSAFGKKLRDHPLVRYDLTDLAVRTAAGTALLFYAVDAYDRVWLERPPYSANYHYARFLSHLVKNRTAEHAAETTRLAMELFGGLGFLDEYAVARLHREALVTGIWEGAANIQALDMLESIQKKHAHERFLEELNRTMSGSAGQAEGDILALVESALRRLAKLAPEEAQWRAKEDLNLFADALQAGLLNQLSRLNYRYHQLAELFTARFLYKQPYPSWALNEPNVWRVLES